MSRSFSSVQIHYVFSTKDRIPFLKDQAIREEMHRFLAGVSKNLDGQPLLVGGVADHVHILAGLGKSASQAGWVKEMKRISSVWIKERNPSLSGFAWQGGYAAFSVDKTSVERVWKYIERQEEHHHKESFQEEFLRLLEEHDLKYDSRFIWE